MYSKGVRVEDNHMLEHQATQLVPPGRRLAVRALATETSAALLDNRPHQQIVYIWWRYLGFTEAG
jgi:hypothetical protein